MSSRANAPWPTVRAASQRMAKGGVSPVRVLMLVEATFAGVRRHVVDLIEGMVENSEVEIHLGYSQRRADANFLDALDRFAANGVRTFVCDMSREIRPVNDLKCMLQVAQYVRKNRIGVIHCHSGKAGFLGRAVATIMPGVHSVYTPNASPFRISRSYYWLERIAGNLLTDVTVAVSNSERTELEENKVVPGRRIRIIENGIPDVEPETEEPKLTVPANSLLVGSAGRLCAQKAPIEFAKITKMVLEKVPEAHFLWIGDGGLRSELEDKLAEYGVTDKVTITGWVRNADQYLQLLDVFVLASAYESFGYGTVEAMRTGVPCVVSRVAGSLDVVDDGVTGYVVDFGDVTQFAERIIKLARDPQLRSQLGDAGRERWKQRFHASRMVRETVRLYQDITGNPQI